MISASLRIKILIPLLVLSILPLIVTLFVISQITEDQIKKAMDLRKSDISNFVERTTTYAQLEKFNYLHLISENEKLVSAIEEWEVTGKGQSAEKLIVSLARTYRFDILEILDDRGNLEFCFRGDEKIPPLTSKSHPIIQASFDDDPFYEISRFNGHLAIVSAVPVKRSDRIIGHLVGVALLNERFANTVKSGSGAEIAFYSGDVIEGSSHPALSRFNVNQFTGDGLPFMDIEGKSHALFTNSLGGPEDGVIMALNQSELLSAISTTQKSLLALLAGAMSLALLAGVILSHKITTPLKSVVTSLKSIANGEGDLTQDLQIATKDEVGELASAFNRFVKRLRYMVNQTRSVSKDLAEAAYGVRTSAGEVSEGAGRQSKALDDFSMAIKGIEESISGIAGSTGSLLRSAEDSSSSILELDSANEQIASQIDTLSSTVEDVSSSIYQMSSSIQQVAENIETLTFSTEATASSINELDASIKDIKENAKSTKAFSDEAAQDAIKGKQLVHEAASGIENIRKTVDLASDVIEELGHQSKNISKVLTVIDEITDQTSLLALNASIIAAQAGTHGNGFAVVAGEIRDLSERTAASTREIALIIDNLQAGASKAVGIMKESSEKVHIEVSRSQKAGSALEKIRVSTLNALEQIQGIVQATHEQARGSQQLTSSINQVTSMLNQIALAIRQQRDGSRQLARAAEAMKEIAFQGKIGTAEQAKGSKQIAANMETIKAMIENIDSNTNEQTVMARRIVETVGQIRDIAEGNTSRSSELDQIVETLSRQTATLEKEVGNFKT